MSRYRIGRVLGRGGMGRVNEAWRIIDGVEERVAIKRIAGHYADDAQIVALFRREAQIGAALDHPGIVRVLDLDMSGDELLLVMEIVDGTSLDVLGAVQVLTHDLVREIFRRIVEPLDYLHARGVAHRDIKPANILVSRDGEVKIADLGLARYLAAPESEAGFKGTVPYCSPEAMNGARSGVADDVYAAVAVLYELLAGSPPFGAVADNVALRMRVKDRTPLPDDIPADLLAIIEGTIAPMEQRTIRSAGELLDHLAPPCTDTAAADTAAIAAAVVDALSDLPPVIELPSAPRRRSERPRGAASARRRGYGHGVVAMAGVIAAIVVLRSGADAPQRADSPVSEPRQGDVPERQDPAEAEPSKDTPASTDTPTVAPDGVTNAKPATREVPAQDAAPSPAESVTADTAREESRATPMGAMMGASLYVNDLRYTSIMIGMPPARDFHELAQTFTMMLPTSPTSP